MRPRRPVAYTRAVHPGDAHNAPPIHCVLWHGAEAPPTPELTALLAQRGLSIETCTDPYSAAARVCRHQRAARARRDDPAHAAVDPGTLVLLLCEPSRLCMRAGVARVLELHAPRTVCWIYEHRAGPTLRTVPIGRIGADPADVPPSADPADVPGATGPTIGPASGPASGPAIGFGSGPAPVRAPGPMATGRQPPRLSLAGGPAVEPDERPINHTGAGSDRGESTPKGPINSASLLTDEELAMLLADDDPTPPKARMTSRKRSEPAP